MGPPEDEALLRDMLDHARRAVAAAWFTATRRWTTTIVWDVVAGDLTAVIGALEELLAGESAAE